MENKFMNDTSQNQKAAEHSDEKSPLSRGESLRQILEYSNHSYTSSQRDVFDAIYQYVPSKVRSALIK